MRDVIQLKIQLGEPYIIGSLKDGLFKIIPILSGNVCGMIQGKVLPFGADYNKRYNDVKSSVDATYIIETKDHELIMVRNQGDIDKNKEIKETKPQFFVDRNSKYAYLMKNTYLGKIVTSGKSEIEIVFWEVENDKYR